MMDLKQYFVACPKGLELLLVDELQHLGGQSVQAARAGCFFSASMLDAYRCVMWSRLASRLVFLMDTFSVQGREDLYDGIAAIDWTEHLPIDASFAVSFSGISGAIRNTQFGAQVVKDAIVDQIKGRCGKRPQVNLDDPDVTISLRLHRNCAHPGIVLASSLSQHGYRTARGDAPLRENLAAAVLIRAGWPALKNEPEAALYDPLCGSGTLLIEGALMAADCAPGLLRHGHFPDAWLGHRSELWASLLEEAEERRSTGLSQLKKRFWGGDNDERVLAQARLNAQRAGVDAFIDFFNCDIENRRSVQTRVSEINKHCKHGLIVTNPPYGERLGSEMELLFLYRTLGSMMREQLPGWQGAVITSNPALGRRMGLRSHKQYALYNGALACKLLLFNMPLVGMEYNATTPEHQGALQNLASKLGQPPVLSKGATMFANRLKKNLKHLKRWAQKNHIECYRIYDADLPEYAVAIDLYGEWVRVQEYQAPASINQDKAKDRLNDVIMVLPSLLEVPLDKIVLKQRQRQKGKLQYQRQSHTEQRFIVQEGGCQFLVNMKDFLDTGLFLDHRPLRMIIQQEANRCRFLNLFCYTATATVHAVKGGARDTVSIDMSKTYLGWAKDNFELNNISLRKHTLVQEDCLQWLERQTAEDKIIKSRHLFDIIYLDPPTFSNSKRMLEILDVQRDHVRILDAAMRLLAPSGKLYFSNNYRRFVLDPSLLERYHVKDITHKTLDKDFANKLGAGSCIHHCWLISHCMTS